MSESFDSKLIEDPGFQSLLVACLEALQRGEAVDRAKLRADHPEYAAAVESFLDHQFRLEQETQQFLPGRPPAGSDGENTVAHASGNTLVSPGDSVRYIGDYEILEEIARGGMGVVFKARQKTLKRVVALKMILVGKHASVGDVERFRREARAAGRLKHPNIVPIHEVGEYEGHHYFTMDLVEGQSLADLVREETLAPRHAAEIVAKVAGAVDYAHREGILHRDLKPANILIDHAGAPHTTDFGLAKLLESEEDDERRELTTSGQVIGTPSYMAPEQAAGNSALIGPASDIYSLGGILYSCIAGRAPFVAESTIDTLMQVMQKDPVPPRTLNPSVPKDLETICLKCLTKEPHKRYGTAKLLADDLGRFLEGRPVIARPLGPFKKTARWCRRNKVVAALLGAVFLSMAVGTVAATFYADVANKHAAEAETQKEYAVDQRDAADQARQLAERRGADLRRQLYVAHMPRALTAWRDGNATDVRRLLQRHVPRDGEKDLRGFEWRYLKALTESPRLSIDTGRVIWDADISTDGALIAIAAGKKVQLHNLQDGRQVAEFSSPDGYERGVSFDSTGALLCIDHSSIELWNVEQNSSVWKLPSKLGCVWLGFTPDDSLVVSVSTDWGVKRASIQVVDAQTGLLLHKIAVADEVYGASITPAGDSVVATCSGGRLRMWDLKSGVLTGEWACDPVASGVAFLPDANRLVTGNTGGRLAIHDVDARRRLKLWTGYPTRISELAADPAGGYVAGGGSSQIVYVLDSNTGARVNEFRGHTAKLVDLQYRPGHRELVSCDSSGVVHVWPVDREQGVLEIDGNLIDVGDAAFSPDGRWLAWAEGIEWRPRQVGKVRLFDLQKGVDGPVLDAHRQGVFGVGFTDQSLYSAGYDGKLISWDLEAFEPVATRMFDHPISALAVCQGTNEIVVGAPDGRVLVINGPGPGVAAELRVGNNVRKVVRVAVSPDGAYAVGVTPDALRAWDLRKSEVVLELNHATTRAVGFSPDGKLMAASMDGDIVVYNTDSWDEVVEIHAHSQPVAGLAFDPSSDRLATRSVDGSLKLWETSTWQNMLTAPLTSSYQHDQQPPLFSPDGRLLLADRNQAQIRLLSTSTTPIVQKQPDKPLRLLRGHSGTVSSLGYSPDGRLAVSATGWPQADRSIRVWDATTGREVQRFENSTAGSFEALFMPDSKRVLSGADDGFLRLWDISSGAEVMRLESPARGAAIALSDDGRHAAVAARDGNCYLFDLETRELVRTFEGHEKKLLGVDISPDGSSLITCGADPYLIQWSSESGEELLRLDGHDGGAEGVQFSRDGRRAVSCGRDGRVVLWDLGSGEMIRDYQHPAQVNYVLFANGGQLISACRDGRIYFWDAESGEKLQVLKNHLDPAWSLAVSPDGRRLLSGGGGKVQGHTVPGNDWPIRMWSMPSAPTEVLPGSLHADP